MPNKDQTSQTSQDLVSEIDEFLSVTDQGVQEPVEQEQEQEQEQSEEVEEVTKEVDDTSVEDEGEDELATLRKQNQALLEQLGKAYQEPSARGVESPSVDETPGVDDVFGGRTFDQIIESEDSFKDFLGDFAKKVMTRTEERLLQKLPSTVSRLTSEQMETRNIVDTFYAEHSQLAEVKPFVAKVVSVVASEHADWDLSQVLAESADRAYKALGLKKQAMASNNAMGKKPAFASPAKGKRGENMSAQKSKLERELEELMEME